MSEISGAGGSIGPKERKMYEQEYKHSADLFKRALDQYNKADNPYQKNEFKQVMEKAMQVMNETAQELMRKELLKQNEQIAQDYATFQKFPEDGDTQGKLSKDLDRAKRSLG